MRHTKNNRTTLYLTLIIIALLVVICSGIYLFTNGATNQVSTKQPSAKINKQQNSNTNEKTSTEKPKNTTPKETSSTLWNDSKNNKLEKFMANFGNKMNQDYDYFNPQNQDNYLGVRFPEVLSQGRIRVNGSPVSIGWSDDGNGSNDYNVVAIYSDTDIDRNKTSMPPHLYLFTIHDGQPVALVTQQTQGNNENAIYFKPTANQDVSTQFANIVNNNQMNY